MTQHTFATPPRHRALVAALVAAAALAACGGDKSAAADTPAVGTAVALTLMETTDLHQNILCYD